MKTPKVVLPLDMLFYFFEKSGTGNLFPLWNIYVVVGNRDWLLKDFYVRFYEYLLKIGWPPLKKEEGKRKPQISITQRLFNEIKNLQSKGMYPNQIMETLKRKGWKIIPHTTSIITAMNLKEYYTGFSFPGLQWVVDFLNENLKGSDYQISKRTISWYVEGERDPDLLHMWLISKRLGITPAELQQKLDIKDMHSRKPTDKLGIYILSALFNSEDPLTRRDILDNLTRRDILDKLPIKVDYSSIKDKLITMHNSGYLIKKRIKDPELKREIMLYAVNGDFKKLKEF